MAPLFWMIGRKILIGTSSGYIMAGWETYEPPVKSEKKSGKWLFTVLAIIIFVNIFVVELSLI
jgi:hypothetical protein